MSELNKGRNAVRDSNKQAPNIDNCHENSLEQLTQELVKPMPDMKIVADLTKKLGIPFSEDPVMQIDIVLNAINLSVRNKVKNREVEG